METLSPNLTQAVTGQYQLEIKKIFREAWQKVAGVKLSFWGAFGWLIVILLLVGTVGSLFTGLANYFQLERVGYAINFTVNLINGVISSVLSTSLIFLLMQHIAGHKVRAKDIFNFNGVLKRLIAMGLIGFSLKLGFLLFSMLGFFYLNPNAAHSLLMQGALATFTALTIYLIFQLSLTWHMAWLLVIEKQMTIWLAVKISFRAINKKIFKNMGLLILSVFFVLLSALVTLGIALCWTFPMIMNINAIWYRQIFGIEAIQHS